MEPDGKPGDVAGRVFEPRALSREALEVPVEARWRSLPPEAAKEFHEKALAQHRKFASFGPRMLRRMRRYGTYGAVGYAIFGSLLLFVPLSGILLFSALGLLAGLLVARFCTGDFTTGAILGGTMFVSMVLGSTYPTVAKIGMTACASLLFGSVGILLGREQEWKRLDGEDL